jgi:N-methylhydantoinase B
MAAGRNRGGIGTVREFTFLADGAFSVEGDGHKYRPWGFDGGADGYTASLKLIHKAGGETDLVSKVPYHKIKAGDHLVSQGPSGGGYGNPLERDPQSVVSDVLEGFISPEIAASEYGVIMRGNALDVAATQARRSA